MTKLLKFKLGLRVFKTAVALPLAVYIGYYLELNSYTLAGIIAMLTIQQTKKKTVKMAKDLLVAVSMGIVVGSIVFTIFGFNWFSLFLAFALFIPVPVLYGFNGGIVIASVVVEQLFVAEAITWAVIQNALLLVIVGASVGVLANLFMPKMSYVMTKHRLEIENNFKDILNGIADILENKSNEDPKIKIKYLEKRIQKSKNLALIESENHFKKAEDQHYVYFNMRQKQLDVFKRILFLGKSITNFGNETSKIANFLRELSLSLHHFEKTKENTETISQMLVEVENLPLPATKEELLNRAVVLQIVKDIKFYLTIKLSIIATKETK
ncbi:MAG: hypothetical protein K0R71_260 [Bacillales bacterium]|jgi:uncharacterized membrane protein YgaE (UPF0421/DUF939 family)|nr:hypothetical protein [Bacillales bacterium]